MHLLTVNQYGTKTHNHLGFKPNHYTQVLVSANTRNYYLTCFFFLLNDCNKLLYLKLVAINHQDQSNLLQRSPIQFSSYSVPIFWFGPNIPPRLIAHHFSVALVVFLSFHFSFCCFARKHITFFESFHLESAYRPVPVQ